MSLVILVPIRAPLFVPPRVTTLWYSPFKASWVMFIFRNINNDDVNKSMQSILLNPKYAKINEKWALKCHKTTTQMVYFLFGVPIHARMFACW